MGSEFMSRLSRMSVRSQSSPPSRFGKGVGGLGYATPTPNFK